jgi:hypothetical protein
LLEAVEQLTPAVRCWAWTVPVRGSRSSVPGDPSPR